MFQRIPLRVHLPEIHSREILLPPVLSTDSHLDHLSVTPIWGAGNPRHPLISSWIWLLQYLTVEMGLKRQKGFKS